MISPRSLFSFSKIEVDNAFKTSHAKVSYRGFKLLQSHEQPLHGKILIVLPRACGKAHDRNRLRRQLRSIFYEHKLYQNKTTWILLVRKDAMNLDFETLTLFLTKACAE